MRKGNSKTTPEKPPNNANITENGGDCHLTRCGVAVSADNRGKESSQ